VILIRIRLRVRDKIQIRVLLIIFKTLRNNFVQHYRLALCILNVNKMPRKKVDQRIRVLIENNVKTRMRSMFVVVGDRAMDQVSMF